MSQFQKMYQSEKKCDNQLSHSAGKCDNSHFE